MLKNLFTLYMSLIHENHAMLAHEDSIVSHSSQDAYDDYYIALSWNNNQIVVSFYFLFDFYLRLIHLTLLITTYFLSREYDYYCFVLECTNIVFFFFFLTSIKDSFTLLPLTYTCTIILRFIYNN